VSSAAASFQATTTQILAGATQAVGFQCQTLLNGMLFDSERAMGNASATATMVMAGGGGAKGGEGVLSYSR
jgi:hypothetical protein